jgi:hypothetical protein
VCCQHVIEPSCTPNAAPTLTIVFNRRDLHGRTAGNTVSKADPY